MTESLNKDAWSLKRKHLKSSIELFKRFAMSVIREEDRHTAKLIDLSGIE